MSNFQALSGLFTALFLVSGVIVPNAGAESPPMRSVEDVPPVASPKAVRPARGPVGAQSSGEKGRTGKARTAALSVSKKDRGSRRAKLPRPRAFEESPGTLRRERSLLAGGAAVAGSATIAAAGAGAGTNTGDAQAVRADARPAAHAPQASVRPSVGEAIGLKRVADPLALQSSVALVVDSRNGEVLVRKNVAAVLPIASITKLMTAMVVLDSGLPLAERLQITRDDFDWMRHTNSRLHPGAWLSRAEMLQLALMASENRAAHALGRQYPGGMTAFVAAMNARAASLGMRDSRFVEPTGLSSANVSSGRDLAQLVRAASAYPLIRQYSTARSLTVQPGREALGFYNTNRLISTAGWSIGLQKTGFISEAGNCLVMTASVDGRPLIFVLLDATGKLARFGDAQRIRSWIEKARPPLSPLLAEGGSGPGAGPLRVSLGAR